MRTPPCVSCFLPISWRKGTISSIDSHFLLRGIDTVLGILTFMKRLTGVCLQSLHHHFITWAKPDTTSLLLGTLIDLPRSKSQLVAENMLLRQQLIILRRQVKRPDCTKTDRMLRCYWQ